MIWLTGAVAFFTLGLVFVGILQWSAMRGQLSEMRSGSADTHELAVAAGEQAKAATSASQTAEKSRLDSSASFSKTLAQMKAQTEAAQKTFALQSELFLIEQRPYVWLKKYETGDAH